MAAAEVDVPLISSYCTLPKESITTLLDAPTAELVRALLDNVADKAREHNQLASDKLKLGVELENAVRGGESKSRVLKGSVDRSQKEAADLRQKLQAEEATRASLETELKDIRASTSESSSELAAQNDRISALEASNRDTLSLLENKTTAYDKLTEELNAQHQKTIDLRRNVSSLEQSLQSANAASTNAKFHEESLQQEIDSLKRTNDWLGNELQAKSGELTKFRKEKALRITELQRQYEEAQTSLDAAGRTETNLRRRLDELGQKADDAFAQIQQMQEEAAKRNESFRVELDAANRLTELTRNSANTERQRQQDLLSQLEAAKDDASAQIGRISAELETEHQEREASEAKIAELEVQVEHLQADLSMSHARPSSENAAHQGVNGFATPTRSAATPIGSPSMSRSKGGLSMTQMYSNYNELKSDVEFERRRNEKLTSTLDEMIQDLETRQPEIEELRLDHERLQSDITEMSSLVDAVSKERDQALKGAKKHEGQLEAKAREGDVLRQQLRDLSSQVKVFLMEVHLRDQGHDSVSADMRAQLERLAQGQTEDESQEGMTDTDCFISENLVAFRSIGELQEQNTNLLKITRELGEKMEHEESIRKQLETTRDWDDLQQKYERCKDEIKSLVTQSQSYIRERDIFRRMLSQRGQLPPETDDTSVLGDSVDGNGAAAASLGDSMINSVEDAPSAKDLGDYIKLYKDMQAHFDAFRNEALTDRSTLKGQVDELSRVNGQLRSDVVRGNSQVTLAHERYEMLQANYAMLRKENEESQKRSQLLSDSASKQEMRVQQAVEDLVENKGLIDSMRNETANLKAEKEFWKTIEKRITEDNENLLNERSRLNIMSTNLQNLLNERELSDNEARRRLQNQIDSLDKELQTTKSKLSEESEEHKRIAQRREYDNEQSQKRISDLVTSLSNIREQLVAANTTKDHLLSRVDELTIELHSAEERVSVLQPPSQSYPNGVSDEVSQRPSGNGDDSGLSKEQELGVQASELKRDLELTKAELENVKGQVEQYKAISQASEEELLSLNEAHDLYRQETDKLLEEKSSKIKELEQRIEDTTTELASTNSELSDLRNEQAEHGRNLDDQKRNFEGEIARLKDQDDRHAAAAQYYQEDLRVQADIAQQAQQSYENELVKHADAAKALQKVRGDYNGLKLEIVEVKTDMESARNSLRQSEDSWVEARERYERELADLKAGRERLKTQNDRLHQQLESHITTMPRSDKRTSDGAEIMGQVSSDSSNENQLELIQFLRREKEIIDVQLELSVQEGKRLKQQFDYTQSQLDDTRLRLNQQRRIEADSERSNLDHNKLMDTINELNTFRESSVTLRAETRQAQAALANRTSEVEELKTRIEPLQTEILELKNERESQEGEMKLLKENSDRWQQRAQNVLQKYDRIDPAELEALKEQLKALENERDELLAAKQDLQEQADTVSSQIAQVQEQSNEKITAMRARLTEQFKTRSKTLSDTIKEKDAALQTSITEKNELDGRLAELSGLQAELDKTRVERDAAIENAGTRDVASRPDAASGSEDGQVDEGEKSSLQREDYESLQYRLSAAESQTNTEASRSASLQSQLDASQSRITELEGNIKELQTSIDASKAALAQMQATAQDKASNAPNNDLEQQIAKLRQDLALAQQDAENLRAASSINATMTSPSAENGSKSVDDRIAEHVAAVRIELEKRHEERIKDAEASLEKRTNQMKNSLTKKLSEGKAQIRETLTTEHQQALQKLETQHKQEVEELKTRHQDELKELQRNENSRFLKLREVWEKEHDVSAKPEQVTKTKQEDQTSRASWQLSEEEAKDFLQSNEVARAIIKKNIVNQVTKAKEELSAQLKTEHEKALAEAQTKANTTKDHAVMMEGKKTALQVNMANNKSRIAQFKISIVEKAAQETPEKPIKEVWSVAKDAKPPPIAAPPQQEPPKVQQTTTTASPAQGNQTLQTANSPLQRPPQSNEQEQTPVASTFGRPSPIVTATQSASSNAQQSPRGQQARPGQVPSNPSSASSAIQRPALNTDHELPESTPSQAGTNHHPNGSTASGVVRGLQQSGLPIARGGSIRGNPNTRGRGSGIGRGGPQSTNATRGPSQGRGSPPRGGMNAGAKQFVPGNKRPRDEEMQGGDPGVGKRIRGGGAGGAMSSGS